MLLLLLLLRIGLNSSGNKVVNGLFFDTLTIRPRDGVSTIVRRAVAKEINLRFNQDGTVSYKHVAAVAAISSLATLFLQKSLLHRLSHCCDHS